MRAPTTGSALPGPGDGFSRSKSSRAFRNVSEPSGSRSGSASSPLCSRSSPMRERSCPHVGDDCLAELAALALAPALHHPRELVGHVLARDRPVYPTDDEVRRLV